MVIYRLEVAVANEESGAVLGRGGGNVISNGDERAGRMSPASPCFVAKMWRSESKLENSLETSNPKRTRNLLQPANQHICS